MVVTMICQSNVSVGFVVSASLPVHIASYKILSLCLQVYLTLKLHFMRLLCVNWKVNDATMLYGVSTI